MSRPRTADAAWVHAAAGGLKGLSWVALGVDREAASFGFGEEDGAETLRATNLAATLPPAMVEAAAEGAAAGDPGLLGAMQLLLALPDWLTETRATAFGAHGCWVSALEILNGAAGVDAAITRGDPEATRRVAARLPAWGRRRGEVEVACELARQVGASDVGWTSGQRASGLGREWFACRDARWWAERAEPDARCALRIEAGALRFQPESGPGYAALPEDVIVEAERVGQDGVVARMLPVWAGVRVV